MSTFVLVPGWFATPLIAEVIAAFGYVSKLAVEGWSAREPSVTAEPPPSCACLREAFFSQRRLVGRLEESLHTDIAIAADL